MHVDCERDASLSDADAELFLFVLLQDCMKDSSHIDLQAIRMTHRRDKYLLASFHCFSSGLYRPHAELGRWKGSARHRLDGTDVVECVHTTRSSTSHTELSRCCRESLTTHGTPYIDSMCFPVNVQNVRGNKFSTMCFEPKDPWNANGSTGLSGWQVTTF
mmetsp:Transcript_9429/g.33330  ORF Transcript_9429/g.33330 Transcript_9429/m.33330 type:complete len:160 (+) Transcript_9429:152-631(+)